MAFPLRGWLATTLIIGLVAGLDAPAEAKDCTSEQRQIADQVLQDLKAAQAATSDGYRALLKRHLPFGEHISGHAVEGGPTNESLLVQGGYLLKHDADLRTALWVAYELTGDDIAGADGKDRVNCFRPDARLKKDDAVTTTDYDEPLFDQGHMANDAAMKDELNEQLNTYVMSNMSPQYCRFNRGIWLSLEHFGRAKAEEGAVHITSGAVFDFNNRDARDRDRSAARMGSRNQKARVAIPSSYYKVFLQKDGDTWRSLSVLLRHNNEAHGKSWNEVRPYIAAHIVPLAGIEAIAEVTLHPDLDRSKLKESLDGSEWGFATTYKGNLEGSCS